MAKKTPNNSDPADEFEGKRELRKRLASADAEAPVRYSTLQELYGLEFVERGTKHESQVERCYRYLDWAIREELPGFTKDGKVSVSAAARGFQVSRNTVAQAVERLVKSGQLEERPKSPYVIVSSIPTLPDLGELMGRHVSVTEELGEYRGGDAVLPLGVKRKAHGVAVYACIVGAEDSAIPRDRLRSARHPDYPRYAQGIKRDDEVRVFTRIRYLPGMTQDAPSRIWWVEQTLLKLPDDIAEKVERKIHAIRQKKSDRVSLTDMLTEAGVLSLCAERNLVRIDTPPVELLDDVGRIAESWYVQSPGPPAIPGAGSKFLRLSFGQYASRPPGVCGLTVCYVAVNNIDLFVHDFRVPNDLTWHLWEDSEEKKK